MIPCDFDRGVIFVARDGISVESSGFFKRGFFYLLNRVWVGNILMVSCLCRICGWMAKNIIKLNFLFQFTCI